MRRRWPQDGGTELDRCGLLRAQQTVGFPEKCQMMDLPHINTYHEAKKKKERDGLAIVSDTHGTDRAGPKNNGKNKSAQARKPGEPTNLPQAVSTLETRCRPPARTRLAGMLTAGPITTSASCALRSHNLHAHQRGGDRVAPRDHCHRRAPTRPAARYPAQSALTPPWTGSWATRSKAPSVVRANASPEKSWRPCDRLGGLRSANCNRELECTLTVQLPRHVFNKTRKKNLEQLGPFSMTKQKSNAPELMWPPTVRPSSDTIATSYTSEKGSRTCRTTCFRLTTIVATSESIAVRQLRKVTNMHTK